ncbi:MAG: GNAT family N-acetyltransferase, partial [Chloroflexi bacterium]|nr:GNAT family N-acetyltransferase [Chloroflexota bacterium]
MHIEGRLRGNRPLSTFLAWRPDRVTGEPRAVGFLSLIAQPEDPTATYVGLLTAHPEWHGFGVGRELLTAALDRTVSLGLDRIDLHTWSGNLKAMPLYKKTGFFWVPDTTVRMANFLPMLLKIGPVQDYFGQTGADWYRDAVRTLDVTPDREMFGNAEVYTYQWVRDGQMLRARIDRHANALLTLETPHLAINVSLDDTRLPIGTTRHASVGITVPTGAPHVSATIVATGEGAVRASHQAHRTHSPRSSDHIQGAFCRRAMAVLRGRRVVMRQEPPRPSEMSRRGAHQPWVMAPVCMRSGRGDRNCESSRSTCRKRVHSGLCVARAAACISMRNSGAMCRMSRLCESRTSVTSPSATRETCGAKVALPLDGLGTTLSRLTLARMGLSASSLRAGGMTLRLTNRSVPGLSLSKSPWVASSTSTLGLSVQRKSSCRSARV